MAGQFSSFIPKLGEKVFIAGKNGSGKTAFAGWILLRIPVAPVFIYDTKIEPKFDKLTPNKVISSIEEMEEAFKDHTIDYIIVRPPETLLGKPEELDEYLWYHYLHFHHTVAYIDEGNSFHTTTGRPYKGLLSLMQRGRSKGILTIIGSQRPVGISRSIISEMNRAYIFTLQDMRDRQTVDNVIPEYSTLPQPRKHQFYYWETGMESAVLFEPIKLDPVFDTGYTDVSQVKGDDNTSSTSEIPATAPTKHVWV
jgi:hypothetical protein